MKIAFLHYHLKPGGVTTVIQQQVRCIKKRCETLVLYGDPPFPEGFPGPAIHVPGIGYNADHQAHFKPQELAQRVIDAIKTRWPTGCDLLHVHNPTLAKNRHLLDLLDILKDQGLCLFLQIHDFAEDGRPGAYFRRSYPENCHWGVINSRDHGLLKAAGLTDRGLHRIANTVTPLSVSAHGVAPKPRVLYPIRAIRRKNIGEAILLSRFLPEGEHLAITLPPNSPADQRSYADWKRFCKNRHMAVDFEVGLHEPFPRLVQQSRSLVTTSITEGFGFSFLEAWTAGKLLWGRRLTLICADFVQNGIDLSHLYEGIQTPLAWIDTERFASGFKAAMAHAAQRFGYRLNTGALEAFMEARKTAGTVDFGQLHESHQKRAIHRVINDKTAARRLIDLNPWLENPGWVKNDQRLIDNNRSAVARAYSSEAYGDTLMDIYTRVRTNTVTHRINKRKLLDAFLCPESFCLLKWCDYDL
ncbi:MAG: hypothetical protein JEZ11_27690 [Desulfobacterales bacterium]|nr:hypothetical protein [Desulfobacterales bacterium]